MFKGLQGRFEQRKRELERQAAVQQKTQAILTRYLGVTAAAITYNESQMLLSIETNSKAAASELLFRVTEIHDDLRRAGIAVKRLAIR